MTDELELLLEEEEEREERELPDLFPAGSRRVPGRIWEEEGTERAPWYPEGETEWGERSEPTPLTEGGALAQEAGTEGETPVEKAMAPGSLEEGGGTFLRRGMLRQEAAGRFYRALLQTGHAAGYRRAGESGRTQVVSRQASEAPLPDAADLDRLFRRDARRYDGGFTWQ